MVSILRCYPFVSLHCRTTTTFPTTHITNLPTELHGIFRHGNVKKIRQRRSLDLPKRLAQAGVALLPCLRTESTLRAPKERRPSLRLRSGQDWTNFFEHSLPLSILGSSGACMGYGKEIFHRPRHWFGKSLQPFSPPPLTSQ